MSPIRRVLLLRLRSTTTNYSTVATTTRKSSKSKLQKPTEIPFQPKLANSVNLIGTVNKPIHFQTSTDGNPSAATVITRLGHDPSQFLIPLVFHGDLALTAQFHLKLNDVVHVEGQLSTEDDQIKLDKPQQYQFQVKVQSLNFVEGYPRVKKASLTSKEKSDIEDESENDEIKSSEKDIHSEKTEQHDTRKSWRDVINKPSQWKAVHSPKESPKNADFESKTEGELQPGLKQSTTSAKKYTGSLSSTWGDLLDDPKKWWDFRDSKRNGSVNPKYPDFKRKDGNVSIWLDKASKSVLSRLKELEFDTPPVKPKQTKDSKGDESWNDLLQNPAKWWDNRVDKKYARAPDFKHKDTGVGLWLRDSPSWVSSRLKELEVESTSVKSKQAKDSKGDESWNDLLQNPAKWWDNRLDKKNPKGPDFKHKDTGEALWLRGSPSWVLPKLPPLKPKQQSAETSWMQTSA